MVHFGIYITLHYIVYKKGVLLIYFLFELRTGEHDMDRVFKLPSTTFIGGSEKTLPLRYVFAILYEIFCEYVYDLNVQRHP